MMECRQDQQSFSTYKEAYKNTYDSDPVASIDVTAALPGLHGNVYISVQHVTESGERIDRFLQYRSVKIRGKDLWVQWSGVLDRNSSIRMVGTLVLDNGQWTYTEKRFDQGRPAWISRARCDLLGE